MQMQETHANIYVTLREQLKRPEWGQKKDQIGAFEHYMDGEIGMEEIRRWRSFDFFVHLWGVDGGRGRDCKWTKRSPFLDTVFTLSRLQDICFLLAI